MTRAGLRRGVRKQREAREAGERKARRVWAASLSPPPLELVEGPEPCRHTWGEAVRASFSGDGLDVDLIRACETCRGFVRRCKRCRGFHLPHAGQGGEYSMPWWVSEAWLKEHGCRRRDLGVVPIPFVWLPDSGELPMFDLAAYGKIDGDPGSYQLEWFS